MNRDQLSKEMQEQIKKSLLSYSIFRPESAVVIALTLIMVTLSILGLPWFPGTWWMWALFGALGEGLIVLSSLRDQKFYQQVMNEVFHEKYDARRLNNPDLRQKLLKALEYRELIAKEIDRKPDEVLDEYLRDTARGLEDWIAQVYRLALGLDDDMDQRVAREMQTVQQELSRFKAELVRQKGTAVQASIEKTISIKQSQWDALSNLRDTREKARLQLEDTLSAISTVYTQIVLLGSKDVNGSRAQRLQQDMFDQVHALQDTSDAMDEVYQSSGVRPSMAQTAGRTR
jgi:NTP pyrophosphatase (non-canonical NTP hydrolase)